MNFFSSSSVPCNHRSETPQGFISAQATARVTTFSFPLFCLSGTPPGRLYPVAELLSSAVVPRKVRMLKTASPGRCSASHVSAFRSALSGCTVSVCRGVYTNHRRTSSSFFKNFVFFCNNFSKILKNQHFQKSHFWHLFKKR